MSPGARHALDFRHEAIFYRDGVEGFLGQIAPMVADTLRRGGSAAVAAPRDRIERLHRVFDGNPRLELLDMAEVGVNPARIIPVWRDIVDRALPGGTPFLGVGEPVWAGRDGDELDECHRHEALINVAFADDPAWRLVCPYDVDALAPEVIADARRTHPVRLEVTGQRDEEPIDALSVFDTLERPLTPVPRHAERLSFDRHRLSDVRDAVRRQAGEAGLSAARTDDLTIAATEMATNSIRHGGGGGEASIWHGPGVALFQTSDRGRIADPMVGRRRPPIEAVGGRGVWLLHHLCDLVQIRRTDGGTVVRITLR